MIMKRIAVGTPQKRSVVLSGKFYLSIGRQVYFHGDRPGPFAPIKYGQ